MDFSLPICAGVPQEHTDTAAAATRIVLKVRFMAFFLDILVTVA